MKILYAAMKYDYGIPERGFSFEHYNFYDTLVAMGHEVEYFDFVTLFKQHGRDQMTKMLKDRVGRTKPDLLFTFLFKDEFNQDILKSITDQKQTVTFNWFADDHWRFDNFSRHWAECFTFVSTTDVSSLPKYKAIGYSNVLLTQWGANPNIYNRRKDALRYDVTFVGQAYGERPNIINSLRTHNIDVKTWGTYWRVRTWHRAARKLRLLSDDRFEELANSTRTTQDEMVEIFRTSRINLNLSGASQKGLSQVKGRNFEIPACGGFQLSEHAERLDEFFQLDKEIVCYESPGELVEKIRHYLDHEDERRAIADAGYERVMRHHTYAKRLNDLFRQMKLIG